MARERGIPASAARVPGRRSLSGDRREVPGRSARQEKARFTHPAITTAIADQHRRDLITQASTYRLARAARQGRPRRPVSPVLTTRRVITTAAAACTAAVFVPASAGPAHASALHFRAPAAAAYHRFSVDRWR